MGEAKKQAKKLPVGSRGAAAGAMVNPFDPVAGAALGGRTEAFFKSPQGKKLLEKVGRTGRGPHKREADKRKAEKKAEAERKKQIEKIQAAREARTDEIRNLFGDFNEKTNKTGFKGPDKIRAQTETDFANIQGIDTSAQTDLANQDVQGLRAFGQTAGDTDIAKFQLQGQELAQGQALDDITKQSALGSQSAFENLAARGGASAGARERVSQSGANQALLESQRQRRFGQTQQSDIRAQDAARKLQVRQSLPGQQLGVASQIQSGQQAQAGIDLSKAGSLQDASKFDVASQQAAQQFKTGNLANLLSKQAGQESSFGATQLLAKAQRDAAKAGKRTPEEVFFDPMKLIKQ